MKNKKTNIKKLIISCFVLSSLFIPLYYTKAENIIKVNDIIQVDKDYDEMQYKFIKKMDSDGKNIIWTGYLESNIYLYNIETNNRSKIEMEKDDNVLYISIFDNTISYITESGKIYLYNIKDKTNQKIYELPDKINLYPLYKENIDHNNNYIVWNHIAYPDYNNSIYLYNINSKETKKIFTSPEPTTIMDFGPKAIVREKDILWLGKEKSDNRLNIYQYTLADDSLKKIGFSDDFPSLADSSSLSVDGDNIIFIGGNIDDTTENFNIYVYNLNTKKITKLPRHKNLEEKISINNNNILWTSHQSLYLYNLKNNSEYTFDIKPKNSSGIFYNPTIKNNILLWEEGDNIYYGKFNINNLNNNPTIDQALSKRLSGKLLLQVEDKGRIWYVSPKDNHRYEVTFANALPLFQKQALGINNVNLYKIPINVNSIIDEKDTDNDGYSDKSEIQAGYNPEIASNPAQRGNDKLNTDSILANSLKGKLLLQVEDKGRIWYVDKDGYRWEVTWSNLMNLFRQLALGINNTDLNKIAVGTL